MDKLVSIAMTTYNGEKYLREQLDSIYNQTYKNIEVIVCDDRSTDKTPEILEEYKQKYGLQYYINETNLGYVKNFENAVSLCSGEFIALSDQDDIWLPEKIETLVNEIGDFSLVYSDAGLIDQNGESLGETKIEKAQRELGLKPAKSFNEVLRYGLQGCASLFKKDIVEKIIPFPQNITHDSWIGMVSSKINGIKFLDKPLIKYRLHLNNTLGVNKPCLRTKLLKVFKFSLYPLYILLRYFYRMNKNSARIKEITLRGL